MRYSIIISVTGQGHGTSCAEFDDIQEARAHAWDLYKSNRYTFVYVYDDLDGRQIYRHVRETQ